VISSPLEFNEDELYVDLESVFGRSLFLKCEGFNFAGSIKLKAAMAMVNAAERTGVLTPGAILVESSSGNLGVALSVIAASKGYQFVCVTDPRCNLATRRLMEALGSQVHTVTEPDANSGFLGARMRELGKASVIRTSANGQPAAALYTGPRDGKRRLHSLHVLTVAAHGVSRVVAFQDIGAVRRFDLPASRS